VVVVLDGAAVVEVDRGAVVVVDCWGCVVVVAVGNGRTCACAVSAPPATARPVRPTSTTPSARRRDPGDSISGAFAAGTARSFPSVRIVVAHAGA
jgi:predicted TIM-barrel fold metal-dependent hydrolase